MKKKSILLFILLLVLLTCTPSWAKGGIYLGLLGGFSVQKPSLSEIEFTTDTTFFFGVRAGVKVWNVTIEGSYFQAAHNLELKEALTFHWGGRQIDYSFIGVNIKYDIVSTVGFSPFLTAGFGYYTADIYNIDKESEAGFNLGLGMELRLGENFAILAEGKFHHVKVDILDIITRELSIGDFTFAGGLSYYF